MSVQGHAQCACMLQVSQYSIVGVLEVFHLIDYIRMSARPHIHTSAHPYIRTPVDQYIRIQYPWIRTSARPYYIHTSAQLYIRTTLHPYTVRHEFFYSQFIIHMKYFELY